MRTLRVALLKAGLLVSLFAMAQGFNRRYDGFGQGFVQGSYGLERSGDGWVVLSGSFEPDTITVDSILGSYRYLFTFLDGTGDVVSEKRYIHAGHSTFLGWADCCDSIPGGGFVIGGSSRTYGTDVIEARLVRFNTQGDPLWSRSFGSPGAFWIGQQLKHLNDGGFMLCGSTDDQSFEDGFVIRTDPEGNELWRHLYGYFDDRQDLFTSFVELPNGFLLTGLSRLSDENSQFYRVMVDHSGVLQWEDRWGGAYEDGSVHGALCADGTVLLSSFTAYAIDATSTKPYLAKLDPLSNELIWEREYGLPTYGRLLFAAKECLNADIIACGVTYEGGNEQGLLLRATSEGDSLWMRNYSYYDEVIDSCRGRFWDVLPTDDGGFIAAGFANGPFGGPYPPGYSQDAWVVKVDDMGCVVPGCDATGVAEIVTNLLDALTIYPNPVPQGGPVTVQLALPEGFRKEPLRLSVVSAEGRLVEERELTLRSTEAPREGDSHASQFTLHTSTYASGLYHLHLTSGTTWLSGAKLVVE